MHQRAVALFVYLAALGAGRADAACNVIPSATGSFRGALGAPLRPFAAPGEAVEVKVRPELCDVGSEGFVGAADEYVVTVVFTPPANAQRNVVILSADCSVHETDRLACQNRSDVAAATCVQVDPTSDPGSLGIVLRGTERHLSFRFPDTDALFAPGGDQRTFTGPATVAVTRAADPIPCGLASARCRSTPQTVACIDELYDVDGTCRVDPSLINRTFGHFTALPPPNDYARVCTPVGNGCTGTQDHVRFTVDSSGNILLPVDWRGILVSSPALPIPRLLRASTALPAFGSGSPIRLPSKAFVASYTPEGIILPPIFEPQLNAGAAAELTLFGSADAPYTILRVARRGPNLEVCDGGSNDDRPCASAADCPGGTCTTATCVGGTNAGATCGVDAECPGGACGAGLFDLSGFLQSGTGPIVLPRLGSSGVCDAGLQAGQACPPATCPGSACVTYRARASFPVPLDGLLATEDLFAFVTSEPLSSADLNVDGDQRDAAIVTAIDRDTGESQGQCSVSAARCTNDAGCSSGQTCRAFQRASSRFFPTCPDGITGAPPLADAEDEVVAFLEPEGTGINFDANLDGDRADSVVRIFDFARSGNPEVTLGTSIAVDPSKTVNGGGVAISNGRAFYRRSEQAQVRHVIRRASVNTSGGDPNGASGILGAIDVSRDGRYVVFASNASNLVSGDTNGVADVFLYDRTSNTTERISVASGGAQANGESRNPQISWDGFFVSFESEATNLVAGDTNGVTDVFLRGRFSGGITVRVSVSASGAEGNGPSFNGAIRRGGGQIVAFASDATNLVAGDTNGVTDVFVRSDHLTGGGDTLRASVDELGVQGNGPSGLDGIAHSLFSTEVTFSTEATNLAALPSPLGVPFIASSVYVLPSSATADNGGNVGFGPSVLPSLSSSSFCGGLAFEHDGATPEVMVSQLNGSFRFTASLASDGTPANASSGEPSFATDEPYIAFSSLATNLAVDPAPGSDVFVHDLSTGSTTRVSGVAGTGNGASDTPALSADGLVVAFRSDATDLIAGDANGASDVFTHAPDSTDTTKDVTGDGGFDDVVLERFDVATGVATAICPSGQAAVAGGTAVFLRPESAGNTPNLTQCPMMPPTSLNGDGDFLDDVVHLAPPAGSVQNLGLPGLSTSFGPSVAISAVCSGGSNAGAGCDSDRECPGGSCQATWVAAVVRETGGDLNGDGDSNDGVAQAYRVAPTPGWTNLGRQVETVSSYEHGIQVQGSIVAFETFENEQGNADMNGDGDIADAVMQVYDAAAQAFIPIPLAVSDFQLGRPEWIDCGNGPALRQLLAVVVEEQYQGNTSLNGDSDTADGVLQVMDLSTGGPPVNVGQAVYDCLVPGCTSFRAFRINHNRVKFITREVIQGNGGTDLNNDGDKFDDVIQVYDACTNVRKTIGTVGGGDPLGDEVDGDGYRSGGAGRCFKGGTLLLSPGSCARLSDCPPDATACVVSPVTVGSEDSDGDGVPNAIDNCPTVANDQVDTDLDGVGDACDGATCGNGNVEPGETCDDGNRVANDGCSGGCRLEDGDGDGIRDSLDNCPDVANDQADLDQDGLGDVCDPQTCGNGVPEPDETCDDGNTDSGDGCSDTCQVETGPVCGNGAVEAGETCDDGNTLPNDGCSATCQVENGCGNGAIDPGETCDDGNTVPNDGCSDACQLECSAQPMLDCRQPVVARKSSLKIVDEFPHEKDSLKWKWAGGQLTDKLDFGDPTSTTSFALCIYDEMAGAPFVLRRLRIPAGGICGTKPCWKDASTGYKYVSKSRLPNGVGKLALKAGLQGKAVVTLTAKGALLLPPDLPLAKDPAVVVQLQGNNGQCWGASYLVATANDDERFIAKSP